MTGPMNPQLSEPILLPFLSPTFSPTEYLNTHLPSPSSGKPQQPAPSLSTLASQTQSHISALNAQQARLSNTLTDLTDDILRTSSRLAYEVELLRGEAVSLAETLSTRGELNSFILQIIPNGLAQKTPSTESAVNKPPKSPSDTAVSIPHPPQELPAEESKLSTNEPTSLPQLRTLHHVRSQLQSVIHTFNLALSFSFPPSLLATTASSLVSLQAPNADPDAESKGQAALAKLKGEVIDLLRVGETQKARGIVKGLREVCVVWKGTSEEKARAKWVDGLEGLAGVGEERSRVSDEGRRGDEKREGLANVKQADGGGGGGFLRRLRDEIYLE